MAKIVARIFIVCVVLFGLHFGLYGSLNCKKSTYDSFIGLREATGHNDGQQVEEFLHTAGVRKGDAWCAAFVFYVHRACNPMFALKSPAWSPSWFIKNVVYKQGRGLIPQPEDVFGIYFNSKKRVAHVGFIDVWPDGKYAFTVEGNTNDAGSREGDGVYRKRRLKSQIYVVARYE